MTLDKSSRILIVDDSPAILALLKEILQEEEYSDIRTADSVDAGVQAVDEQQPDVVFLDIMMPEESGLDFLKQVQKKNPKIRIVVTTALAPTHESVVMAVSQGAVEYLQKPLQKESVHRVLNRMDVEKEEPESKTPPHDAAYM